MPVFDRHFWIVVVAGGLLGLIGVGLAVLGNPQNSGICISCFLENTAGALGLHGNQRMQYLRPELIGFVLGAVFSAAAGREFRSRGGSAPLLRFLSGVFLMIGCGVFIGCPIKLFLRLTAGDLTVLSGLAGLVVGVWFGLKGLAGGIHLGGGRQDPRGASGLWVPLFFLLLLVLLLLQPGFILFSTRGSGAQHAPLLFSLGAGLLLGGLAQRSRFCITGSVRDTFLMGRRTPLIWGLAAFILAAVGTNLAAGRFHPGFYGQPGAHLDYGWSFLGMLLVGWLSVLIGGCPFRQLIKAGEGDADAGLVVIGMLLGGGLVQAWGLAGTAAGVPLYGKVAVLVGLAFVAANSLLWRERVAEA
ncbi:YedE family putative selenium transporter [Geothermobacter hydrogeniphilus]|uniref:YedE-related selenium metabolism membrane protein n=1 Tax=Geothermobacter hydrogeniphilus TaxID=1969733 RepID=A0A1X0Y8W3_9BACT|nr:YedE family putative selenium transporter [Geothermobacter hydrogeniphilus]ORJ61588.1 YedE-related selenium metabolism membrane protein [Geothermobacter hydrogeniphilus]